MILVPRFGYYAIIVYKEKDPWSDIIFMSFSNDVRLILLNESDPNWFRVRVTGVNKIGYIQKSYMRKKR